MSIPTPTDRELAYHEAAHAAHLCLVGLTPLCARVDWPTRNLAGSVQIDWEANDPDPGTLREVLIATLLGPLIDSGELRDLDEWPVNPERWSHQHDANTAAFIVDQLGLDQVDWLGVCFKTKRRAREFPYLRLVVAIADLLLERELVLQPELIEITHQIEETN